jgi:hypothetical protein
MHQQAFIPALHQNIKSCEGETSNVVYHFMCQKWRKSGVDSQKFKKLLANLSIQIFSQINSIKTYDFPNLYTAIPHDKLKSRLFNIIDNCFFYKNGKRKYSYLVISHKKNYTLLNTTLIPRTSTPKLKLKRCWNLRGGQVFKQSVGILMGTNFAPLLADLFLYS